MFFLCTHSCGLKVLCNAKLIILFLKANIILREISGNSKSMIVFMLFFQHFALLILKPDVQNLTL